MADLTDDYYGNAMGTTEMINPVNNDIIGYMMETCGVQKNKIVYLENDAVSAAYAWVDEDNLCFFPKVDMSENSQDPSLFLDVNVVRIPFDSIIDFAQVGEKYREQVISGGGGGGVNVSGAVIGGLLFGSTGAIIGSREKVKEVKTETIEHDTRQTALRYKIYEGREEKEVADFFSMSSYQVFEDLIPQFEKEAVKHAKIQKSAVVKAEFSASRIEENKANADIEILTQLKRLHDAGVLTDEEFAAKKQDILKRM